MVRIRIIYPYQGYVTEACLRSRLADVLADDENNKIDAQTLPLDMVCDILEDTGKYTFVAANHVKKMGRNDE